MFKPPHEDSTYSWTFHVAEKMRHYGISEGRIRRIIRYPQRTEEGIAENTIAVMAPAGTKRYQEVWVMYKLTKSKIPARNATHSVAGGKSPAFAKASAGRQKSKLAAKPKIKVITAWRYPGESPARDPVPAEVIREVRKLL